MIDIVKLGTKEGKDYINMIKNRSNESENDFAKEVEIILKDVSENGDSALLKYTKKFDFKDIEIEDFYVSKSEMESAYKSVDSKFIESINLAEKNIRDFHEKQKKNSWMDTKDDGIILGQKVMPLDTVGIYVPGGTASYPSSVMMNAIPAKVAGVRKIVMATPPSKDGMINPYVLAAAYKSGIDEVYKIGGAQAIAALAFGTDTIPKVDKIVGPGNIYVALAKKSVYGYVDIDMIAGPSEVLIISDESGDEKFIAADLMAQAEHDVLASSILITTSMEIAKKVKNEISRQIKYLERKDIIKKSLKNYGAIIVVDDIKSAVTLANSIAPEHLEIITNDPFSILGDIKNAGSIFLGSYSPEPLGDYMAGPNHVLPTSGTARFFSPLSVDDFIKKSSFIYYSNSGLYKLKDNIVNIAEVEGLTAHANSIKVRYE